MQRIIRNYYEQLYAKKLDSLGEMDKFLETYNLPKLNQEEAESLNKPKTSSDIEAVIKKLLAHRSLVRVASLVNFTKHSKNTCCSQTIPKKSRRGKTPKLFL